MGDYLTPEQTLDAMLRMIPCVVTEAAMRVGVARGGEFQHRLNGFFLPHFDSISFRYVYYRSCLDLVFAFHQHDHSLVVWDYRVLGQNERLQGIERFVDTLNAALHMFMPGIVQSTNYCRCQNPMHSLSCKWDFPGICLLVGDKWICNDCMSHFSLLAQNPVPSGSPKREQAERAKMTASLRFSILERDGFTCRSCGRSAREDGVKLHVDHIVAIANGGKTEPDNLHTLCQDCNLGKSDKRVEQMELWK